MAGHALAVKHGFPDAVVVGVEPDTANDFERSLVAGARVRVDKPMSICDGLLSYDVGEHCWPLLRRHVTRAVTVPDRETKQAMRWL
jgi:threonine dehydratase